MRCLYVAPSGELRILDDARLEATTERHKLELSAATHVKQDGVIEALDRDPSLRGVVIEMNQGWIGRNRLWIVDAGLGRGRRVWAYWPTERAIECIDRERAGSLRRHWAFITVAWYAWRASNALERGRLALRHYARASREASHRMSWWRLPFWMLRHGLLVLLRAPLSSGAADRLSSANRLHELDALIAGAVPVPFPLPLDEPSAAAPMRGTGVYLRTDFWSRIDSGGSYGHTCYVAKELAACTERFVCFMAHRYRLLDDYGLRQVVLEAPSATASEDDIVSATPHYRRQLASALDVMPAAYIYERLCLGNYAGALLSRSLKVPYIVEYNGSEISMRRSFDGTGYVYEEEYIKAEMLAFKQATMISVVSAEVKATLVARGIDADKILVNPNGADVNAYAPASPAEKRAIRGELGIAADGPVIGFTGTFGGWHGVDVLAAAIPKICERVPSATFLLIGDGNYKHLVDAAVAEHRLANRVVSAGRVPQSEGARLLKACDVFVSPHNSHMVDSRFFGSPTKIFEYMAMAAGIVASDLEQIGTILSPALRVAQVLDPDFVVTDQRAVLCTPGDVEEFVEAVVGLVGRPDLGVSLGRNARLAVEREYSWIRHVSRLWPFAAARSAACAASSPAPERAAAIPIRTPEIETGDSYKDEVQRQWDNDPAGSHYVKNADPHTLPWFLEAETYRYGDYAPWMAETMEFAGHAGERVLEIGGGMGTDLAQFARHGASVTDIDLSSGHLELAKQNFRLRGLSGEFVLHDAESLVFENDTFDLVYSNGVLHHTPNTRDVVREIRRVLKPGGRAIVMMYAENSLHYWRNLVWAIGIKDGLLHQYSMGEIMSRSVERSDNASARPLVKVYTKSRLASLFDGFTDIDVVQRQMVAAEVPRLLTSIPLPTLGRMMGWNVIIKARKPGS